ncbi:hypothetical protein BZY94_07695 [Burkholderia territorii]|nr:hypothetical protein BZY94_07695 [Burkholderia territorii]
MLPDYRELCSGRDTKILSGAISIAAAVPSVWRMSVTLKILPLGTAYAVWAGASDQYKATAS